VWWRGCFANQNPILTVQLEVVLRMRLISWMVLTGALATVALGQSAPSTTTPAETAPQNSAAAKTPVNFEIADIHPSPRRRYPFFDGGFLVNGRYLLRQATLVDLIATAYGQNDSTYVHGGPSWLEWDRWDVIAKVPPGTTEASAKQMLQSLLAQRLGLVVHTGSAPMPAYVLTAPTGKGKLKDSDGTGDAACKGQPPPANQAADAIPQAVITCHNETMEKFAEDVHMMAGGYLSNPVVDSTGLKGAYDFDLNWTPRGALSRAGSEGISIFDAVDKELGLKLTLETAPRPVLIVDSVNETPTPNAPDLATILPPLPPVQFEVATIKPSAPDEKQGGGGIQRDGLSFHALPLKLLINFAWDLDPNATEQMVGAPKWLDSDKIDVEAKVGTDNMVQGGSTMQGIPPIALEDLREMLKELLIERFEIKAHTEDLPEDAYSLVAVKPKMTKADPTERARCDVGPGPADRPIMNMLVKCQNVTMAQAAELFPTFAAWYLHYPVVDKTGLEGGWDFTLNWSSGDHMPGVGAPPPPDAGSETASDPNGAVSFYDAVSKELGLKLVKEKRPEPVLVIDHIDEQPTPN
jgi:uncharacterized protein (TIGR03435 family)